jgi:hypothetical protein
MRVAWNLFDQKVRRSDGCWIWTGALDTKGYGRFVTGRKRDHSQRLVAAHRLAFLRSKGPIPPDTLICHRCDTPACVRPDHLFAGSQSDNVRDAWEKGRSNWQRHGNAKRVGVENGRAKLTPGQVQEIRRRFVSGMSATREMAAEFGVTRTALNYIRRGEHWKSVPQEPVHGN